MAATHKYPISLNKEDVDFIESLQKINNSMVRSAYVATKKGLDANETREMLRARFDSSPLDFWFKHCAASDGEAMVAADKKLGVKTRVFGGKANLRRLRAKLITKEEWAELRLMPIYSIGEKNYRGNRKFSFHEEHIIFKPYRGTKIILPLPKMSKNRLKLWRQAVLLASEKRLPITVRLSHEFICVSFDETKVKAELKKKPKPTITRYAGVDLNPNYVGVSVFDGKRLVDTKLFSIKELTERKSNHNKLKHETSEIAHQIGRWLTDLRVAHLFIEKLSIKSKEHNKGRAFNSLVNNKWLRTRFVDSLKKHYPDLIPVCAAYTSTIGNVLNPTLPDPVAASTAVAWRGYELEIKKTGNYFPPLPDMKTLSSRWNEMDGVTAFGDWKELHDFLTKKAKLKYRVPVPDSGGFRIFRSRHSHVGVI